MRTQFRILALVLVATSFGRLGLAAEDKEEKIAFANVPAKVAATVKAKYPDAKWTAAEKETEDGKTFYEVAIKVNDQKIDVICQEDGTLEAIEKTIAAADLPEAVRKAIEAKYPKATTSKAEEIIKGNKTTYEALLITADKKKLEVQLDGEGKVLEEEKKDEKKE
ncbi:MAG: PepSY-like domain-containing protein [Planctomycetia bacterium]|nr:PepSY-like domain-containing protein [Planctomycetia bacterium]